jgi:hypothetical protein
MDDLLSKQLSPEGVFWGISLLCSIKFISSWMLQYNLPITWAMISEFRHSDFYFGVGEITLCESQKSQTFLAVHFYGVDSRTCRVQPLWLLL